MLPPRWPRQRASPNQPYPLARSPSTSPRDHGSLPFLDNPITHSKILGEFLSATERKTLRLVDKSTKEALDAPGKALYETKWPTYMAHLNAWMHAADALKRMVEASGDQMVALHVGLSSKLSDRPANRPWRYSFVNLRFKHPGHVPPRFANQYHRVEWCAKFNGFVRAAAPQDHNPFTSMQYLKTTLERDFDMWKNLEVRLISLSTPTDPIFYWENGFIYERMPDENDNGSFSRDVRVNYWDDLWRGRQVNAWQVKSSGESNVRLADFLESLRGQPPNVAQYYEPLKQLCEASRALRAWNRGVPAETLAFARHRAGRRYPADPPQDPRHVQLPPHIWGAGGRKSSRRRKP